MSTYPRIWLLFLVALIFVAGGGRTSNAQSTALDESAGPNGILQDQLTLSPVQRSAIYNAVMRQSPSASSPGIAASIGAAVPPSAALFDLPDQAIDGENGGFLKYAMVDGNVVVVDPIAMRVIDVIHPGAVP